MFLRVENPRNRDKWYFKRYVYKCDRCGKEFTYAKKDSRTTYCGECHSFLDKAKAKERRAAQLLGVDELKQKVAELEYINGCLLKENNRLWELLEENKKLKKALDKAITYIMNIKDKDCMIDKCFKCPLETKCDNARNVRAEWAEWLMNDDN